MTTTLPPLPGDATCRESSMSDEAFRLINCYYDGIDHIVRELAEQLAIQEGSFIGEGTDVVAIELRHVKRAGEIVLATLGQLVDQRKLPESLRSMLAEMDDCACGQ